LSLAALETGADFLDLRCGELRSLLRHWRRFQLADCIEQRDELVNLQKGAVGLGDADPQALGARGIVLAQLVRHGIIENLSEQGHHHLDRAQRQGLAAPAVLVRGASACLDDFRELVTVGEQLCSKARAVLIGDPSHQHAAEEREDMLAQPPEVVLVRVLGQWRSPPESRATVGGGAPAGDDREDRRGANPSKGTAGHSDSCVYRVSIPGRGSVGHAPRCCCGSLGDFIAGGGPSR
jgi:hypothetical protein